MEQTLANSNACSLETRTFVDPVHRTPSSKRESFDLLTNGGQFLPDSKSILFNKAFLEEEITPIQFSKDGSEEQLFSLNGSQKHEQASPMISGTSQFDVLVKPSDKIKEFSGAAKTQREERLQKVFQKILASNEISQFDMIKASQASKKNLLSSKPKNKPESWLSSKEMRHSVNQKLSKPGLSNKMRESVTSTKQSTTQNQKPQGECAKIEKITQAKVFSHNSLNRYRPSIIHEPQATQQVRKSGLLERSSAVQKDSNRVCSAKSKKLTSLQEVCQQNYGTVDISGPSSFSSNIYDKSARRLNTASYNSIKG